MSESEMPEDIRATAKAIRDKLCIDCECTFDRGCGCLDALSEALLAERTATNQRWRDLDETARESGLLLGPTEVAEAVMAERERAAKIADAWAYSSEDDYLEPEYEAGRRVTARSVAAAIRQDNPNDARKEQGNG